MQVATQDNPNPSLSSPRNEVMIWWEDLLDLRSARWVDRRPKKIERAMTLAQVERVHEKGKDSGKKIEEVGLQRCGI